MLRLPDRALRFCTPDQSAIVVRRDFVPGRVGCQRPIVGIVVALVVIRPIVFVNTILNVARALPRSQRPSSCSEADFQVEISTRTCWRELDKPGGEVVASPGRPIAYPRLRLIPVHRVP